jgi:hypothetical protein
MEGFVILLVLLVLMVRGNFPPTGSAIPYPENPGDILVQLAVPPGRPGAERHTVPEWTLYGDGTLIFQSDPSDTLWRAQLSPGDIQHILKVIITQDKFFATTQQRYGTIIPGTEDENELLLTVNADGQQKQVMLMSEPSTRSAINMQTTYVFAIQQFLLAYHPLHSMFYAPDPAADRENGRW